MPALPFTWRSGMQSNSSVKIAVFSQETENITVSLSGNSVTQSTSQLGTGAALSSQCDDGTYNEALNTSVFTFTGLAEGKHLFSVTQNGVTRNGTTWTTVGDIDCAIAFVTCDHNTGDADNGGNANHGSYRAIQDRAEDTSLPPVVCLIHTDDHGYVDKWIVNDSANSGKQCAVFPYEVAYSPAHIDYTAGYGSVDFGYYLAYAAYLGLIESESDFYTSPYRVWCHENIPTLTATGDHEFVNNPETDVSWNDAERTRSMDAYKNTVGVVNPYLRVGTHFAWVLPIGSCDITCYDRIQGMVAGSSLYNYTIEQNQTGNVTWLGTQQISDLLGAQTDKPFKMVAAATAHAHITSAEWRLTTRTAEPGWTDQDYGAQEPLHDFTADVSTLIADDGEDAVATNSEMLELYGSKSLGGLCSYGVPVFICHGDVHYPSDKYFYTPQDDNYHEISVREIGSGAVNPVRSQALHYSIVEGHEYKGGVVKYLPDWISRLEGVKGVAIGTHLIIEMKKDSGITVDTITAHDGAVGVVSHSVSIERNNIGSIAPDNRRFGTI